MKPISETAGIILWDECTCKARKMLRGQYSSAEWREEVAREQHGWRSERHQARHDAGWLRLLWALMADGLYGLWLCVAKTAVVLFDEVAQRWLLPAGERLPGCVEELLEAETLARLSGRAVASSRRVGEREQHANSTSRAWLEIQYGDREGGREQGPQRAFAKCQAQEPLVRWVMSAFDVYRNELDAYARIRFPVPTPAVHVARRTASRFALVLEDLEARGAYLPSVWETRLDEGLTRAVLSCQARLHAHFWGPSVPEGVWDDRRRPHFGLGMALYTLQATRRRHPGLISEDCRAVFLQAAFHWPRLRAYLSRHAKTLVHGDSHVGNYYVLPDGSVGLFDLQVLSKEHPIRDVGYFLMCSYPPDALAADERPLIAYYLSQLCAAGLPPAQVPSFEEAWFQYRIQSWYTLWAFIFSAGFSNLIDPLQTRITLGRIQRAMDRIDAAGALYDLLDGKVV